MAKNPCLFCGQEISNPVCAACNLYHIMAWSHDQTIERTQVNNVRRHVQDLISLENGNKLTCLICNQREVCICFYCLFVRLETLLQTESAQAQVSGEFQMTGNNKRYRLSSIARKRRDHQYGRWLQ